ncbi:MAG: chorismate mutase, partial [Thermoplasmata archaeon]
PPEALAQARREIESVDRSIVLLIAARLEAARRAIQLRRAAGRHITDREQERRVLSRGRAWAAEFGVPSRLIDELFRSLIEEGKSRHLSGAGAPESPVVTVLVARPRGAPVDLGADPSAELITVPSSR